MSSKGPSEAFGQFKTQAQLMRVSLEAAVPLLIPDLRRQALEYLKEEAVRCGEVVAHRGDLLMFRGKKRGESAEVFNAMARGVAILSFSPGGVRVFGAHFENRHPGVCYHDEIPGAEDGGVG